MSDFVYSDATDGKIVMGLKSGVTAPKKLIIPYAFENEKITQIGSSAFYRRLEIEECVIEARVTIINNHSFFGCQNLRSINIPSSCTTLGNCALDGRIDNEKSKGTLNIYFEAVSSLNLLNNAAISNFYGMNIFIYNVINPQCVSYIFGSVKKLKIYSPQSFMFCGVKTISINRICTKHSNRKNINYISLFS